MDLSTLHRARSASMLIGQAQQELEAATRSARRGPKFSLASLVRQCAFEGGLQHGFEAEIAQENARAAGLNYDPNRPRVRWGDLMTRDMTVAGTAGSNYLVGDTLAGPEDALRPYSVLMRSGAQVISGLRSNLVVPRTTAHQTRYWLSTESTQITPGQPAVSQLTLTPHTPAAISTWSKQLQLQAPGVEDYLRRDLANSMASTVDAGGIAGTGASGEPLGIINVPGINTESGTSLGHAGVHGMLKDVLTANADEAAVRFVAPPAIKELLAKREAGTANGYVWTEGNTVATVPAAVSTNVPAATAVMFHAPSVLLAFWGDDVKLEIDPYSSFKDGRISIRVLIDCDVGLVHPAAVCVASSIT